VARGPDRSARKSGAICAICGIVAGNLSGVPVHRYRLARTMYEGGRSKTVAIASMGMCDPCVMDHGTPPRDYSGRNLAIRHRHIRRGTEEDEWHVHAGFQPRHTHPELGPAVRRLTVEQIRAMKVR
jgi:hypothetical protein